MSGESQPRIVTFSSLYGTQDVEIGRGVAERLGVQFVDREIPAFIAGKMGVPESAVAYYEKEPRSRFRRLLDSIARAPSPWQQPPRDSVEAGEHRYRAEVEELLARTAASGGVILGRAAALVLRETPGALHVRLIGPKKLRMQQAMESEGIDEATAKRRLEDGDRDRTTYSQKLYGADPTETDFFHLIIDTTAFEPTTCIDLIVEASDARARGIDASDARASEVAPLTDNQGGL